MATASRTRVCFSSASRRPRSTNTLPELSTTVSLFFPFAISCLVILACCPEPSRNQFRICPGRPYALRGISSGTHATHTQRSRTLPYIPRDRCHLCDPRRLQGLQGLRPSMASPLDAFPQTAPRSERRQFHSSQLQEIPAGRSWRIQSKTGAFRQGHSLVAPSNYPSSRILRQTIRNQTSW